MRRVLIKRLLIGVLVIFLVSTAVFVITRMVTSPELAFLPVDASEAQRVAIREHLGLDQPLWGQYLDYLGSILTGNLGDSYWQPDTSALSIVFDRLPLTVALNVVAILVALVIAVPLGVVAALNPGSLLDRVTTTASLLGLSAPQFWLSFMLILIFGVNLGWLPTSGAAGASSVILPSLGLALPTAGKLAQMMRSTMMDELDRPYMMTAESKGMKAFYRVTRHAFRNSLVPVLTQSSFEFARMMAGYTIVVEKVFAWPGVGLLTVQALERQDLMLLQAIVIVVATMIVLVNLVTDLLYTVIDPRIEVS
ncbi:MAG: ABC transporter permease [Acidimicrobiales bacterium]